MDLKWQDTEDIAIRLVEEHPETDPLTVRFTDMHAWIVALHDFKDDSKKSNEFPFLQVLLRHRKTVLP
jgi:FeS assembly protein IscX